MRAGSGGVYGTQDQQGLRHARRRGVLAWDNGHACHLPAEAIAVRNTTGAGDTFLAGLAFAVLHRWAFDEAVRLASAAAASFLCEGHGSLASVHERYRRRGGRLSLEGAAGTGQAAVEGLGDQPR